MLARFNYFKMTLALFSQNKITFARNAGRRRPHSNSNIEESSKNVD